MARSLATEFDASRFVVNEKCSVAANHATKPQHDRNTPQQNATKLECLPPTKQGGGRQTAVVLRAIGKKTTEGTEDTEEEKASSFFSVSAVTSVVDFFLSGQQKLGDVAS